jgi:hypothetical protein
MISYDISLPIAAQAHEQHKLTVAGMQQQQCIVHHSSCCVAALSICSLKWDSLRCHKPYELYQMR